MNERLYDRILRDAGQVKFVTGQSQDESIQGARTRFEQLREFLLLWHVSFLA